jgi:hypothetical protein
VRNARLIYSSWTINVNALKDIIMMENNAGFSVNSLVIPVQSIILHYVTLAYQILSWQKTLANAAPGSSLCILNQRSHYPVKVLYFV